MAKQNMKKHFDSDFYLEKKEMKAKSKKLHNLRKGIELQKNFISQCNEIDYECECEAVV